MITTALVFAVFSYGFIDPNLTLSTHPLYVFIQSKLMFLVYQQRIIAAALYAAFLSAFYVGYRSVLAVARNKKLRAFPTWTITFIVILIFSYPALSYDIFNYIATAKVAFFYRENPYIVMPIEIPNEPMLAFTRASNKLALYGPTWIALTSFPHLLGMGNILQAIFSFKLFVAAFYAAFTYLIYRKTKRWDQTLFFALNPLVLIELLVSGHNDIVMMTLGIAGLLLWQRHDAWHKGAGMILFLSSILVKGATIVLLPLLFFPASPAGRPTWKWEHVARVGYWLMFGVFLLSPLREELYPWYAVWWLSFAAFIPMRKTSRIHDFSFWLSLGLMLRYVPWIATREYGGMIPTYRIIVTVVPVSLYLLYTFRKSLNRLFRIRIMGGFHDRGK